MKFCVLILAGGLGTRLRSVVVDVPKSLAPIKGVPFLIYVLDWLNNQEISSHIIFSIGYKANLIEQQIGNNYKQLSIRYIIEDTPLGTGGAIKNSLGQFPNYDHYLILNGDTYATINLKEFLEFHESNHADITIASRLMKNFDRYGALTLDSEDNVIKFNEKTFFKEGFINCGAYLFTSSFYQEFIQSNKNSKFSFEKDILEKNMGLFSIKAFISNFYFKDIGVPEDYEAAQNEFPILVT